MTTATSRIRADIRKNRLQQCLLAAYSLIWAVTAVRPIDPRDWFMENVLVFFVAAAAVATYRRYPLSDLSYAMLALFLSIHAVGAHYTYARVPVGYWFQETFQLSRNHFDRVAHFCFGLLIAYPMREIFLRVARTREFWAYYLPVDMTLAFSALFEIFESWIVRMVNPALGEAYLGAQGDIWDAQKDMTAALTGSILCMVLTALLRRKFRKNGRRTAEKEYAAVV